VPDESARENRRLGHFETAPGVVYQRNRGEAFVRLDLPEITGEPRKQAKQIVIIASAFTAERTIELSFHLEGDFRDISGCGLKSDVPRPSPQTWRTRRQGLPLEIMFCFWAVQWL
jgi:hypothetical protein